MEGNMNKQRSVSIMEYVEPIRDREKFETVKRILKRNE